MKNKASILLEYSPFISIFVMLAVCCLGIFRRAPEKAYVLYACIPIGLWTLFGMLKHNSNKSREEKGK